MEIKQQLLQGLREIRDELGSEVLIENNSGARGIVPAIVYNADYDYVQGSSIVLKSRLRVNILVKDLVDRGLPISIDNITWNRVKYTATVNPISSWEQVLVFDCTRLGV